MNKLLRPDKKISTLPVEASLILSPDLLSQKQVGWKKEGYNKEEIKELTGMLERLSEISDRLKELLDKGDDYLKHNPELFEELKNLKQEKDDIMARRERLRQEQREGGLAETDKLVFLVRDAINPFSKGAEMGNYRAGSYPFRLQEKIDQYVDLQNLLEDNRRAYELSGCDIWVKAMPENIEQLKLTKKQVETIKSRIKAGELPVMMPGRWAQIAGLIQALDGLRPLYGEMHGVPNYGLKVANPTEYQRNYYKKLVDISKAISEEMSANHVSTKLEIDNLVDQLGPLANSKIFGRGKSKTKAIGDLINFVMSIPEAPYIFTAKPANAYDLLNSDTLIEQRKKLEEMKQKNMDFNVNAMNIGEYLALQNYYTTRLSEVRQLDRYLPLDCFYAGDLSSQFSCFIEYPAIFNGWPPVVTWRGSYLQFYSYGSKYTKESVCPVFRTVVRI